MTRVETASVVCISAVSVALAVSLIEFGIWISLVAVAGMSLIGAALIRPMSERGPLDSLQRSHTKRFMANNLIDPSKSFICDVFVIPVLLFLVCNKSNLA